MAMAFSLGGNLLANVLGKEGDSSVLDAAVIIEAPIKLYECAEYIRNEHDGFYDRALTGNLKEVILRHEPIFKEYFEREHGFDIKEALDKIER